MSKCARICVNPLMVSGRCLINKECSIVFRSPINFKGRWHYHPWRTPPKNLFEFGLEWFLYVLMKFLHTKTPNYHTWPVLVFAEEVFFLSQCWLTHYLDLFGESIVYWEYYYSFRGAVGSNIIHSFYPLDPWVILGSCFYITMVGKISINRLFLYHYGW